MSDTEFEAGQSLKPDTLELSVTTPSLHLGEVGSFELFSEFVIELRLMIWKYALPGPRIVTIRSGSSLDSNGRKFVEGEMGKHTFISPTRPPNILFVCRESRAEAMRTYQLSFGCEKLNIPSTIFFNSAIDTLYFEYQKCRMYDVQLSELKRFIYTWIIASDGQHTKIVRAGTDKVKRIGFNARVFGAEWFRNAGDHSRLGDNVRFLKSKQFGGLEKVVVVVGGRVSDDTSLEELEDSDLAAESGIMTSTLGPFLRHALVPDSKKWKDILWPAHGPSGWTSNDFIPELKIMKSRNLV